MLFRLSILLAIGLLAATGTPAASDADATVVVLDPGHGGLDHGARGPAGTLEKDIALAVSRRIGSLLVQRGFQVVYTREDDSFVSLAERTKTANAALGDLYLSIHANAAEDPEARGSETYFLSIEASDDHALRVAMTENRVFDQAAAGAPASSDLVGAILGDLIRNDHLRGSSEVSHAIQRNLSRLPGPSRGVKQAPFVVLMGVNMSAALLEIGFLTHPEEGRRLRGGAYQQEIAVAVADAVAEVRAVRREQEPDGGSP